MTKINRTFRLDPLADKKLVKLAEYYSFASEMSNLPKKKYSKTDVLEFLISEKFSQLQVEENINLYD